MSSDHDPWLSNFSEHHPDPPTGAKPRRSGEGRKGEVWTGEKTNVEMERKCGNGWREVLEWEGVSHLYWCNPHSHLAIHSSIYLSIYLSIYVSITHLLPRATQKPPGASPSRTRKKNTPPFCASSDHCAPRDSEYTRTKIASIIWILLWNNQRRTLALCINSPLRYREYRDTCYCHCPYTSKCNGQNWLWLR